MFKFKMKKKRSKNKQKPVVKPKPKPSYMAVEATLFEGYKEPEKVTFKGKAPKTKSGTGKSLPVDSMKEWLEQRGY